MIDKLAMKHIQDVYSLSEIIRYNTHPKIKQESVATHSYYVTYFSMIICEYLGFCPELQLKVLKLAIVHDIPEIVTNDITYDAKQLMPEVDNAVNKYSKKYLKDNYNISPSTGRENYIVDIADILSVMQYLYNELKIGNKNVKEMLCNSAARLVDKINEDEYYKHKLMVIVEDLENSIYSLLKR